MSDSIQGFDEVTIITDPGERNRSEHLMGDRIVVQTGNVFAWLLPLLMLVIVAQVVLRTLGHNQAWMDDLQWWLYGLAMMAGFAYAITTNSHVRVDIFRANFARGKKARIELFGLGWLLLPFLVLMFDVLLHYAYSSFMTREGSDSPQGLHGLFLLKMMLPVMFGVAIIGTMAALKRYLSRLTTPTLWWFLIAAFPAFVFAASRAIHYVLWWYVRFTQPDILPRRINREPLMDHSLWLAFVLIGLLIVTSYLLTRRRLAAKG